MIGLRQIINKKFVYFKTVFFVSFMMFFSSFIITDTPADAKTYTRSCTAKYSVSVTSPRGISGQTYPSFTGKGTIGYFRPNEARRRARRNLDECIQAHWDRRDMTGRPTQCTESNQIYSYPLTSGFIPTIRNDICSRNKSHEAITVNINALFDGQKGCFLDRNLWKTNVVNNFRIQCPDYPHEPGTDRRGGDYRNFDLPRADWRLCESACNGDARCRAWTVRLGATPRCWLKSTVPNKRPASGYDSGVKPSL